MDQQPLEGRRNPHQLIEERIKNIVSLYSLEKGEAHGQKHIKACLKNLTAIKGSTFGVAIADKDFYKAKLAVALHDIDRIPGIGKTPDQTGRTLFIEEQLADLSMNREDVDDILLAIQNHNKPRARWQNPDHLISALLYDADKIDTSQKRYYLFDKMKREGTWGEAHKSYYAYVLMIRESATTPELVEHLNNELPAELQFSSQETIDVTNRDQAEKYLYALNNLMEKATRPKKDYLIQEEVALLKKLLLISSDLPETTLVRRLNVAYKEALFGINNFEQITDTYFGFHNKSEIPLDISGMTRIFEDYEQGINIYMNSEGKAVKVDRKGNYYQGNRQCDTRPYQGKDAKEFTFIEEKKFFQFWDSLADLVTHYYVFRKLADEEPAATNMKSIINRSQLEKNFPALLSRANIILDDGKFLRLRESLSGDLETIVHRTKKDISGDIWSLRKTRSQTELDESLVNPDKANDLIVSVANRLGIVRTDENIVSSLGFGGTFGIIYDLAVGLDNRIFCMNYLQQAPDYLKDFKQHIFKIGDMKTKTYAASLSFYSLIRTMQMHYPEKSKHSLITNALSVYSKNLYRTEDFMNLMIKLLSDEFAKPEDAREFIKLVRFDQYKTGIRTDIENPIEFYNQFFSIELEGNINNHEKNIKYKRALGHIREKCNQLGIVLPLEPEYQISSRVSGENEILQ